MWLPCLPSFGKCDRRGGLICGGCVCTGPFLAVVGNQTIEVGDKSIAVRTFGRSVELTGEHLTEVRKSGQMGFSVFSFQIGLLDVFFVKEWRKHCCVFA